MTSWGNAQAAIFVIVKACLEFGYAQAQVAAGTGLHYSTVSRIIRREESRFKI